MQAVPAFYEDWDAAEPGQGHAAKAEALRAEFGLEDETTDLPADADSRKDGINEDAPSA